MGLGREPELEIWQSQAVVIIQHHKLPIQHINCPTKIKGLIKKVKKIILTVWGLQYANEYSTLILTCKGKISEFECLNISNYANLLDAILYDQGAVTVTVLNLCQENCCLNNEAGVNDHALNIAVTRVMYSQNWYACCSHIKYANRLD